MDNQDILFKEFVEDVVERMTPSEEKVSNAIDIIRKDVRNYVESNNLKSLVIGISGGLDSAVVAAICQEKYTGVPLIGVSIPLDSSKEHKEQAQWVGNTFCSAFDEITAFEDDFYNIDKTALDLLNYSLSTTERVLSKAGFDPLKFDHKILNGNRKARIRMITLYDIARASNGCVLSTDNYSELWVGFFTVHGDVGDLSPIQYIEKGIEEPVFAKLLGIREDIITQAPSDGLKVTEHDSDEAQLGMNYREIGAIVFMEENLINDNSFIERYKNIRTLEKIQSIIKRHNTTNFKRELPYMIDRKVFFQEN